MSDSAPLQLSCCFCRPLVEGCPSVFEINLSSSVAEPVRDITLEFRCAGLRDGMAERTLTRPLTAFEVLTLDLDIEPERKGTPPMTVHIHASTSRGRFTAHGSVRPAGQAGISILERPADMQSLTVQIQEKAFFGSVFAEGGIAIGKVKTLNDFLQLHLPVPMEPVKLTWDGFPVTRSLQAGGTFAGRFKLIEQLGQGGMGVVWLAEDTRLKGRQVALKFLPETVCHDPDATDDLKRELLLSQELTHENIVRIHDLIEAEGTVAISMEYIRGKTLSALRREQPSRVFSTTQLLPWVQQLCTALDYAHGKGIIHHDLKPLNLMINEAGVLKVCDFGLAGSMAESRSRHSRPGQTSGTTPYMSPQHLLLGSRTVSDDVYALGATLYELLTSKAPFYAGSIETQIERTEPSRMEERRVMLRITGADPVPPEWEAVVQDCLKKKSEDRPSRVGDVLSQLTAPPKMSSAEEKKKARDAETRERAAQEEKKYRQEDQAAAEEKKRLAAEAKRQAYEDLEASDAPTNIRPQATMLLIDQMRFKAAARTFQSGLFFEDPQLGNSQVDSLRALHRAYPDNNLVVRLLLAMLSLERPEIALQELQETQQLTEASCFNEDTPIKHLTQAIFYRKALLHIRANLLDAVEALNWSELKKECEERLRQATSILESSFPHSDECHALQVAMMIDIYISSKDDHIKDEINLLLERSAKVASESDVGIALKAAYSNATEGLQWGRERNIPFGEGLIPFYLIELFSCDAYFWLGIRSVVRNDAEAANWFRLAADQGHAIAQICLGGMYRDGRGVSQNDTEAAKWYRLAADQGNADAQIILGRMYRDGQGVSQNDAEAAKWYCIAASQGNTHAQIILGRMYIEGRGVSQNDAEAAKWYRIAADQGNATAQFCLGMVYQEGRGVAQSDAEAIKWYYLAADQGLGDAQFWLGYMYREGRGVAQSDAEAARWFLISANQGNERAKQYLASIGNKK